MSDHKRIVERYHDGFRERDHAKVLDLLTDDVAWDLPGFRHLVGKGLRRRDSRATSCR